MFSLRKTDSSPAGRRNSGTVSIYARSTVRRQSPIASLRLMLSGARIGNDMPTAGGLFDGAGLLACGLTLAGWEHAWLCESDEFRCGILETRYPGIPVHRDVRSVGARTA